MTTLLAPDLVRWPLVDVLVTIAVVLSVLGALGRRSGVLGALAAGLGTLLVAWLAVVATSVWAPRPLAHAADQSALLQVAPVPHRALDQAGLLVRDLVDAGPAGSHGR